MGKWLQLGEKPELLPEEQLAGHPEQRGEVLLHPAQVLPDPRSRNPQVHEKEGQ